MYHKPLSPPVAGKLFKFVNIGNFSLYNSYNLKQRVARKDDDSRKFVKDCREMLLNGPNSDCGGGLGGKVAVAKLLGISQPTVSKRSNVVVSETSGGKALRKQKKTAFCLAHPEIVQHIISFWVTKFVK